MQPQQSGYAAPSASHSNSWSQHPPQQQQRQQLQQQQLNSQQMAKSELQSLVQQLTPQQREHLSKMPHDKRMHFFHNLRSQMARAQQQQQLQQQQQQQQMSQQGSWQQQPSGPQKTGPGLMHQPGLASQPQVWFSPAQLMACVVCPLHHSQISVVLFPSPTLLTSSGALHCAALRLAVSLLTCLHIAHSPKMQASLELSALRPAGDCHTKDTEQTCPDGHSGATRHIHQH